MNDFSFENLEAYKYAMELVSVVYSLCEKFPSHEKYGLYSQLHRAIVSVPSNIAESCGRRSFKEKIHFLEIAYGSLLESYCQLKIAINVSYLSNEDVEKVKPLIFTTSRLISGLSNGYERLYQNSLNPKP